MKKLETNNFKFPEDWYVQRDPALKVMSKEEHDRCYGEKVTLIRKLNLKVIAEIGVRAGYSGRTFLETYPNAKYYGFDANNGQHGGCGGNDGRFWRHAQKILGKFNIHMQEIDTQKVTKLPIYEKVDLFHVDGDHTTVGVIHDLEMAFKYVKVGGYILVDDYTWLPLVKKGVDIWLGNNEGRIEYEIYDTFRGDVLIKKLDD